MLATAFGLGLLGSTHCLGMCGGINGALAFALQQQVPWWAPLGLFTAVSARANQ